MLASLVFYAWGEPIYIFLMLCSITINYVFGRFIDNAVTNSRKKLFLIICIIINLLLLGYFKYFNFFMDIFGALAGAEAIEFSQVLLPIGISFYTFQALSYIIDLYWGKIKVQKSYLNLALYIAFFPQLIAGPIVRYQDIQDQIATRTLTKEKTAYGIKRFIYGLSKKVLIANTLALVADNIYALDSASISTGMAWIASICYTLQIYFDFSGYSDMAIGLGKMFGFNFIENFNYPYTALSIRDFWRRWHISLSTWFREYLYIPLGGNRKGTLRTYLNLFIVFFVTGLWHGASWNFVVWGIYNGVFLVIERLFLGKWLDKCKFKFINVIYSMLVVIVGWVIFRVEDLKEAARIVYHLFVPYSGDSVHNGGQFISPKTICIVIIGILCCGIIQKNHKLKHSLYNERKTYGVEIPILIGLFVYCIIMLVSGTYNPFIYFRF